VHAPWRAAAQPGPAAFLPAGEERGLERAAYPSGEEGASQGEGRGKGMMERDAFGSNSRERVWERGRRGLRHKKRGSAVPSARAAPAALLHEISHQVSNPSGFLPLEVSPTAS